ncbi:hypothetical protein OZX65_01065 [Leuconostocaceae bacterium ESL0723]|nr:hypothetical protein OZX65_01065 [Leuconostocaceae bacterium ESL0723]
MKFLKKLFSRNSLSGIGILVIALIFFAFPHLPIWAFIVLDILLIVLVLPLVISMVRALMDNREP